MVIDAVRKQFARPRRDPGGDGWITEDNDGMRNIIETIGGQAYKRYRTERVKGTMHLNPNSTNAAIVLAGDRTKGRFPDQPYQGRQQGHDRYRRYAHGAPRPEFLRASRVVNKIVMSGRNAARWPGRAAGDWVEAGEVLWNPGVSPSTNAYETIQTLAPEGRCCLTTADHPC